MLTVERKPPVLRVLDGDRIMWSGRTDAIPPENIVYAEEGKTVIVRVDRCTDADLIHAIEQRQNSK